MIKISNGTVKRATEKFNKKAVNEVMSVFERFNNQIETAKTLEDVIYTFTWMSECFI